MTTQSCLASMEEWCPGWSWLKAPTLTQAHSAPRATQTFRLPLRGQVALETPGLRRSTQMLPAVGMDWTTKQEQSQLLATVETDIDGGIEKGTRMSLGSMAIPNWTDIVSTLLVTTALLP